MGVFVSDSIKEVVPRYLLPLRGVIDSPDIPLNVSRSALQTDRRVRSIGNFVAKKVADRLRSLKKDDPKAYAEAWDSLAPFVKIGAMEDENFADQVAELILFGTTAKMDSEGVEVLKLETVIDTQFIPWLEQRHDELNFQRVDAELDESLRENDAELADQDGTTESDRLRDLIKDALGNDKVTIQVQALKGDAAPPAMILLPEQMRRLNDLGALMEQRLPGLPDHHVLLVNRRHPLVE